MPELQEWIAAEARFAAVTMAQAISATSLVMDRPGFGQRIVPLPGSVLASPVIARYDPDPDYFFHWFRDSAIVIDALRVALGAGYAQVSACALFDEFVQFSRSLLTLDGPAFLRQHDFRAAVQPACLQYLRPDEELQALSGAAVLADTRVNADGSLDIIRWSRPQSDGPAMRSLALLRWSRELSRVPTNPTLQSSMRELLCADLAFTHACLRRPCSDIWEERQGLHYYVELLQAEALRCGADLPQIAGHQADIWREAAQETLARLDQLWDPVTGCYLAREPSAGVDPQRDLDISVILGVLHARRPQGTHSVLDPRVQATLTVLEELFEARYSINRALSPERGPALGRYASDRYYSGGAWYLATLGGAEFYFTLAQALADGAALASAPENLRFRQRMGVAGPSGGPRELAGRALARGDSIMRTVRAFTPQSGELSEQFDQTSGLQTSAKHLSWSYAAFITAAAQRTQACLAIERSYPAVPRADRG